MRRETQKKPLRNVVFALLIILILINPSSSFGLTLDEKNTISKLETKVAKGYSGKFCNAIGIGLSKESAIRLSIVENIKPKFNPSLWLDLTLSGKSEIEKIDELSLIDTIVVNISKECGYPIGLKSKNDIQEFKEYFLSIKKEII